MKSYQEANDNENILTLIASLGTHVILLKNFNNDILDELRKQHKSKDNHYYDDFMYLDDPAAMTNLLLNMADRNIVSDEFVQRHIKAKPDIERRRVVDEEKVRVSKDLEKISPYHAVDKQYGLEKIALQTGVASPSQVGVELKKKKTHSNCH